MYRIVTTSQNPLEGDDWQNTILKNYEWIVLEKVEPTETVIKQEIEEDSVPGISVFSVQETITLQNYQDFLQTVAETENENIPAKKPKRPKRCFECDVCKRKFSENSNLIAHKLTHDENYKTDRKRRKCDVCEKIFYDSSTLNRHKALHTGEKPYKCEICNETFGRKDYFNMHWRSHYGLTGATFGLNNKDATSEKSVHAREKSSSSDEKLLIYKCDVCHKTFSRKHSLYLHKRLHLPYKCDICNNAFSMRSQYEAHLRNHSNYMPPECKLCPGVCEHANKNAEEQSSKSSDEYKANHAYQCDICLKPFAVRSNLLEHQRAHFGIKIFECDVCFKKLSSRGALNIHKRIHTGERPYKCEYCPRAFVERKKLKFHTRLHTGEKPYECNVCMKKFSQVEYLKNHHRTHTGERPFECEICHKFFAESSSRCRHRKTHFS